MRISEKFCYRAGESRPEREQLSVNAHLKSVERLSEGCRASHTGVTSEAMFPGADRVGLVPRPWEGSAPRGPTLHKNRGT
jgi:hypothetical protein